MQVTLFKQDSPYVDSATGEVRHGTNFFIRIGSMLIPIQVKNFSTPEKADRMYSSRRSVCEAMADLLPPKSDEEKPEAVKADESKSVGKTNAK